MDIEQYRRNAESRIKVNQLKQSIKKEIEEYEDRQLGIYETSELKYAPIIKSSQEVKTTIDEKQTALTEQLHKNQLALTEQLQRNRLALADVNRDVMEELGAASAEDKDAKDFNNEYWADNQDFLQKQKLAAPSFLFIDGLLFKNLGKSEFDGYLSDLQNLRNSLARKNQSRKSTYKQIKTKYYETVETVIDALKVAEIKQAGTGIRKYNQKKRNAYKISQNNKYGGLMINMPKLLNNMILEVQKGGNIIYNTPVDKGLIDLLTKKYNPKKKYSSKAIEIFNNLNMLSNISNPSQCVGHGF